MKRKKEIVLVVEDYADTRKTIREMLEALGYLVVLAANFKEGEEKFKKEKPDIALVDDQLKGSTDFFGPALLRRFTELDPANKCRKFLMGGDINLQEGSTDTVELYQKERGIILEGFLEKPFGLKELEKALLPK